MLVQQIQQGIQAYTKWLQGLPEHPRAAWWSAQQHFQQHWDDDAADVAVVYDRSLHSNTTRRLWQVDNWQPKRVLHLLAQADGPTVRTLFQHLFNETLPLDVRVSRFLFGCDLLLAEYKTAHPLSIENNHYHDDHRMIALYLAFRYPDQYGAPYDLSVLQAALRQLGAREVPVAHDLPRHAKAVRTLHTFLEKDKNAFAQLTRTVPHFSQKSLLASADLLWFLGKGAMAI